jgi:hypothetical protein
VITAPERDELRPAGWMFAIRAYCSLQLARLDDARKDA